MRNILTIALLTITSVYAIEAPAPTAIAKRDDRAERVESSLSSLVSSATHAIDEHPDDASSVLSELREQYTSIAGEATGCGSGWARVTNAVGEFDEGIFDGLSNLADEIFGDDDECEENGASQLGFGAIGVALLGVAAIL